MVSLSKATNNERSARRRQADGLVDHQLQATARRTDWIVAKVMVVQWLLAIVLAFRYSPRAWEGTESSIHLHVFAAIFLGGALTLFPAYMSLVHAGSGLTRHINAIAQMLWSALLIHLTGGRIETHFHVFASLALLASYRRWSVLIAGTLVVALDHIIRGTLYPQSVFGTSAPAAWRALEHTAWACCEDFFLLLFIRRSVFVMQQLAVRQVRAQTAYRRAEKKVLLQNQRLRDEIAERNKVEADLRRRDEQFRQAQKLESVGQLAGGIAHEFNNLLQAIRGYTKFGMDGLSPSHQRYQDLAQVIKATDRAIKLTRQLLGFSRRQVLKRTICDPQEVVTDLVRLLRPLIGEQIDLNLRLDKRANSVYADPDLLHQMLLNLCINARDAMPKGGRLTLATQRVELAAEECERHCVAKPGSYVLFSVVDSGLGMSPDVQAKIFEPFFTTKEVGRGTGLGLAMVYGVVQQHEGSIVVDSQVGLGTTIKIYLPVGKGLAAETEQEESAPALGGTETILVAEDEPMLRDVAVRVLTGAGYRVVIACDGNEAVETFKDQAESISLALLDAVMPKLSGPEVYHRIKLAKPELPVIFCSGYHPERAQIKSLIGQGVTLVAKPYDPEVLLRIVREVLNAPHAV
ncbi:MAG TPA: ATP-binding protein [Pirellulales bacterium]|nr:ATP-binding protein [Pirellulales bacterium]